MNNHYENKYAVYQIRDYILYITYKKGLILNYAAARQIVHDRLSLQSYESYPVICNVSEVKNIDFEARGYLSIYGSILITIVALLSYNKTIYSMGRFYIEVNSPKVPTQIFNNLEEAEIFITTVIKIL